MPLVCAHVLPSAFRGCRTRALMQMALAPSREWSVAQQNALSGRSRVTVPRSAGLGYYYYMPSSTPVVQ